MHSTGDSRLHDAAALAEIELYAELVIAASASDRPMRGDEIDRVLGVAEGDIAGSDRPRSA